jgi:hypothetical protein
VGSTVARKLQRAAGTFLALAAALGAASCSSSGSDPSNSESPPCPSIASYCALPPSHGATCIQDWATAQQASAWCTTDAGAPYLYGYADVYVYRDCNGFNVVRLVATDTGFFYLYDSTSGQLVGIGSSATRGGTSSQGCVAGTIPGADAPLICSDGGPNVPLCGP